MKLINQIQFFKILYGIFIKYAFQNNSPYEKPAKSGADWKAFKKSGCLSTAASGTSSGFLAFRMVTQSVFQGCLFLGSSFGQAKEEQHKNFRNIPLLMESFYFFLIENFFPSHLSYEPVLQALSVNVNVPVYVAPSSSYSVYTILPFGYSSL